MPRSDYLLLILFVILLLIASLPLPPAHHSRLPSHPCCIVGALYSPRSRLTVASPSPRRRLAVTLPSPCRHLAIALPSPCPPFHPPLSSSRPQSPPHEAIGIVGRYPYRCCCHHQRRSFCHHLRCLRCCCPDVSVAPDAPAAPPLPPSFMMNPTAVRLRLPTVPRQRRRQR